MKAVALLNSTILTNEGHYSYSKADIASAKDYINQYGFESFIGQESTAELLSRILSINVPVSRAEYKQETGDTALVFKLNSRVPADKTGKDLSLEEINEIGFSLYYLQKMY